MAGRSNAHLQPNPPLLRGLKCNVNMNPCTEDRTHGGTGWSLAGGCVCLCLDWWARGRQVAQLTEVHGLRTTSNMVCVSCNETRPH